MTQQPTLKHIAYRGRRYRVVNGEVLQWRTKTDSYEMAWLPLRGEPELERTILQIAEAKCSGKKD